MYSTAVPCTLDPRTDPDVQLMLRVRQDDPDAFNALVDRHHKRVYRQLLGIVWHHQDAEDLTQDVFLRVFTHRQTYRPQAKFTTWLFRIVLNVGRNAHKKRLRHTRRFCPMAEDVAAKIHDPQNCTPLDHLLRRENRQQIERVLIMISDRQSAALRLYYWENNSLAEIAHRLRTTRPAVDGLLQRRFEASCQGCR